MATIDVLDATENTVAIEKPNANGRQAAADSRPVAIDSESKAVFDSLLTQAQSTTAVNVYPLPGLPVKGMTTQITDQTSTAVTGIGTGGSGVFNYITQITITNTDTAVGTIVELQDGSGGTTFYRLPAPAAINSVGVAGATFTFPTPLKQPTANTALYVKCATTSAEVYVSATGFQA